MKNNIVSKKVISIILIALLLITTKVYAVNDSFTTTINASVSQVKREDTITITIGLKDIVIESGEKGIGAYTASITFDSSILEYVGTDGTDKWEAPFYQNGLVTGCTKDGEVVNTTQSIGTITFKVKEDATLGETTIGLTNFYGSTVANDISASDQSIKLTIVDNNSYDNENNNDDNNGGTSNNGDNDNNLNSENSNSSNNNADVSNDVNDNSNKESSTSSTSNISNTSNVVDTTIKQGKLPKTGTINVIIVTMIGICTLLAITFFIKIIVLNRKKE